MAGRAFLIGEPNRYPSMPERQSLPESHGQRPWFQEVMTKAQRRPAMRRLRRIIEKEDVYWRLDRYLKACGISSPGETAAPPAKTPESAATAERPVEISGL